MPHERDYYDILGVNRSASQDDIKRAYRKLAKQHHPDRNVGDASAEAKFKEVQQAHAVLRDPKKRAEYDQFGHAGVGRVAADPRGRQVYEWGGGSTVAIDDLEDLMAAFGGGRRASVFDELFGRTRPGRAPSRTPRRGADEEHAVTLTFEQAIYGATVTCNVQTKRAGKSETLDVKIPPGVEEGQKIRVKGRGRPGSGGGPSGDLFLVCSIKPHPYFTRRGADIELEVPVSVVEATLGAKIEVPTIDGRATVTLPPGTASETKLRLRGRGIKRQGSAERGDQYVRVRIVPPHSLTDEERRQYEELRQHDRSAPRSTCRWWDGS